MYQQRKLNIQLNSYAYFVITAETEGPAILLFDWHTRLPNLIMELYSHSGILSQC